MKLFKHEFDETNLTLNVIEFEVVKETPKSFEIENPQHWHPRVMKSDIGVLKNAPRPFMFTLSLDNSPFISALSEWNEKRIKEKRKELAMLKRLQSIFLKKAEKENNPETN